MTFIRVRSLVVPVHFVARELRDSVARGLECSVARALRRPSAAAAIACVTATSSLAAPIAVKSPLVATSLVTQSTSQSDSQGASQEERLSAVERENAELRRRIDVVADELSTARSGEIVAPLGDGQHGLGAAASKVYGSTQGVSIGGYGEMLYENFQSGSDPDQIDLLRAVLYVGYKFDEHFLFNSEIEFEHASTETNGAVSVEFAYLDYMCQREINFRAGLMLLPMGFLNEMHEPTAFLGARRNDVENVILPTTWSDAGVGVFGDLGDFTYRSYLVNGLDASGYSADGIREGRQGGSEAQAEDFAWVTRVDYVGVPGLLTGVSAYVGDSGQSLMNAGESIDASTQIVEAHLEYDWRGWQFRALGALTKIDDVEDLNAALGLAGADSIGEEQNGYYLELGYDVLASFEATSKQSLTPFVRWESFDTQAEVPSGFASNPDTDVDAVTFGVNYKPIDHVVIKLDYQDYDDGDGNATDQWNAAIGYIF